MIDSQYTYQQFLSFIKKYDSMNEKIQLKIAHMVRVMHVNIQFAKWQNLSQEEIELAGVIGLLHDIGRFVQIEKYNTFIDHESIDHCQAGVDLLFSENLITYFVKDKQYYYTIEKAIANHGKFEIEPNLDEKTFIQCQLIRDSDKTDIYEVMLRETPDTVFDGDYIPDAKINEPVLADFYNHSMVKRTDVKTVIDDYVRKVAFIYNYYFKQNLQYLKNNNYITRLTERFLSSFQLTDSETLTKIHDIETYGNTYLNNYLKNNGTNSLDTIE